jgi:hypothetical protein
MDLPQEEAEGKKILSRALGISLILLLAAGLTIAGFKYLGRKKAEKEMRPEQQSAETEQQANLAENQTQAVPPNQEEQISYVSEEPQMPESSVEGAEEKNSKEPAKKSQKQMGYIKNVYEKDGENHLDIDYIEWLTGDAALEAMEKDGKCPENAPCLVINDYYIRNNDSQIRTFEISPRVTITMQTFELEKIMDVKWNQCISFRQFKDIYTMDDWPRLRDVPYIVEIKNQKIIKITEQYIP